MDMEIRLNTCNLSPLQGLGKKIAWLPKYLKRISYSMCHIYLMVWQQEILKKLQNEKTEQKDGKIKYNPKVLEPLYLDFISK